MNPVGPGLTEVIVDGALIEVFNGVAMTAEVVIKVVPSEASTELVLSM
jgi:hypothetical protein